MGKMVEFIKVSKIYTIGTHQVYANNQISFSIDEGEFCVIVGPSGAGKTTILNLLGGMDSITEGQILIDREDISQYNSRKLTKYRRYSVGFVFQFYNLLPQLTAKENVEIAADISHNPLNPDEILAQVGLSDRKDNFPSQLSGGEQQRVSIARALAKNPKILLCDEPTGALDIETGKTILQLLHDTCKNHQMTVIIVTHNSLIAEIADKVIQVRNGRIAKIILNKKPKAIDEVHW